MLPMIQREVVDKKGWSSENEVADVYALSQCTPGPIAVNTATYIGRKQGGVLGGIMATLGVVAPSLIIITAVATVLKQIENNPWFRHAFNGISVAVCALIVSAIVKLWQSGVKDGFGVLVCVAALALSVFAGVSPIPIIVGAALLGVAWSALSGGRKKE